MSTLSDNLQQIYTTKLQIKQAIGTSSDDFSQYPTYISNMVTPTGYTYVTANGDYNVSTYQMVNVNVASGSATGTAYFYLVRNPEEENEQTFNFTDDSATAGYPSFSYNFGNFEYTQGSLAQQIIDGFDDPYENPNQLDITLITSQIESPMFTTSEGGSEPSPVRIYVSGPVTIEGAWEEGDGGGQVQMSDNGGNIPGEGQPQVYTLVSVNNLTLHIYKPDSQSVWSCYWDWEIPE